MEKDFFDEITVVKRSGQRVNFSDTKVAISIKKGFDSVYEEYDEKDVYKVKEKVLDYIKKEYKDNIDKYSYDDIEKELSVFCVRNKVNFNLTEEKEDEQVTTFNIDTVEDELVNAPAWMKRAFEVQKEMNL